MLRELFPVLFLVLLLFVDLSIDRPTHSSYLEPDPLLLASVRGREANPSNPRFHALNRAIVQLVCP